MVTLKNERRDFICMIGGTITGCSGGLIIFNSIPLGCALILGGMNVFYFGFKSLVKESGYVSRRNGKRFDNIGILAFGLMIFGFITIVISLNVLLNGALIIGGMILFAQSFKRSEVPKIGKTIKKFPIPVNLVPHIKAPTLEEKFIIFRRKLEWLSIIPRLNRANINILAKVLDLDVGVFKKILPSQMKSSGFQVEGDYIRLPESVSEFINSLRFAFTQWDANAELAGQAIVTIEKINTWISVLEQTLLSAGTELTLQKKWISKLIDVPDLELETLLLKGEGENWWHLDGDFAVLNSDEFLSDALILENPQSQKNLSAEERDFIDAIDKTVTDRNTRYKKEEKKK